MKKKQLIYFFTLTITAMSLLASCGKDGPENGPKPAEQASQSADPAASEGGEKDPAAEGTNHENNSLSQKGVVSSKTDKGTSIKVDYSKYQKKQNQNFYTRLQEAWIPDLKADSGYGMIYPFAGNAIYNRDSEYGNPVGYIYGMIDEKGRIIADPTYADIHMGSYWDSERHIDVNKPVWILTRAEGKYNLYDDMVDGRTYSAVATLDGSFVSECKYGYIGVGEYGFVLAEDSDSTAFTAYDYKGNVIFTEKDMTIPGMQAGMLGSFSDGFFTIYTDSGNYFMDAAGKNVLGPYPDSSDFHWGRAYVNKNGSYCYIDKSGNTIIDTGAEWISSGYSYGLAEVRSQGWDGPADIMDVNGRVILHTDSNHVVYSEDLICCVYDEEQKVECYDHEGRKLNQYQMKNIGVTERGKVLYGEKEGKTYLINLRTGAQAVIDDTGLYIQGIMYRNSVDFESDDSYVAVVKYSENYENEERRLYHAEDMKEIDQSFEYASLLKDPITGQYYIIFTLESGTQKVLNTGDGSSYSEKAGAELYIYNGRHLAFDDTSCRYYDADRKLLFNYVQVNSMGD